MSEHLGWISWLMISTPWQEIKNSLFDGFCCTMTAAQIFDSMSHEHLCVGHTHEDVGLVLRSQVFKRFQYHIKMFDITASRFYSYPLMFAIAPSETLYLDWYPDWFVKETKICQGLTCVPICPTSFSPAISSHPDLPRDLHHKHASGSVHRIWYRHLVAATFLGSKDVQSFCQLIGRKSHCCSAKTKLGLLQLLGCKKQVPEQQAERALQEEESLLPGNLCECCTGLDWQHGKLCHNRWCLQKTWCQERWPANSTLFHFCEKRLPLDCLSMSVHVMSSCLQVVFKSFITPFMEWKLITLYYHLKLIKGFQHVSTRWWCLKMMRPFFILLSHGLITI